MKVNCTYTEMVDIDLLVPNPRNPNKHPDEQIKFLAKIMNHQGWRHPIIVSKLSGFIVSGHGRLLAAKKNGWTQAPVDRQDFANAADEFAHLIADNKIAELAEHDDAMMIEDLKLFPDLDLELLGIPDLELPEVIEPGCEEDDISEVQKNTWVARGDLFQLGEHRLLCGDSTAITDVERLMNGEKADMVFTDPPYGIAYDDTKLKKHKGYKASNFGMIIGDDKEFKWTDFEWLPQDEQIWFGANYYNKQLPQSGSWFVWDKKTEAMQENGMLFTSDFELAWSKTKHKQEICRKIWAGAINKEKGEKRLHPTQKPISLIEWFFERIKATSVIDLFGGSGSTLIACEKTNRKCFMMELDEHYCSVIIDRWEKFSNKKAFLLRPDDSKISWDEVKNDSKNN